MALCMALTICFNSPRVGERSRFNEERSQVSNIISPLTSCDSSLRSNSTLSIEAEKSIKEETDSQFIVAPKRSSSDPTIKYKPMDMSAPVNETPYAKPDGVIIVDTPNVRETDPNNNIIENILNKAKDQAASTKLTSPSLSDFIQNQFNSKIIFKDTSIANLFDQVFKILEDLIISLLEDEKNNSQDPSLSDTSELFKQNLTDSDIINNFHEIVADFVKSLKSIHLESSKDKVKVHTYCFNQSRELIQKGKDIKFDKNKHSFGPLYDLKFFIKVYTRSNVDFCYSEVLDLYQTIWFTPYSNDQPLDGLVGAYHKLKDEQNNDLLAMLTQFTQFLDQRVFNNNTKNRKNKLKILDLPIKDKKGNIVPHENFFTRPLFLRYYVTCKPYFITRNYLDETKDIELTKSTVLAKQKPKFYTG